MLLKKFGSEIIWFIMFCIIGFSIMLATWFGSMFAAPPPSPMPPPKRLPKFLLTLLPPAPLVLAGGLLGCWAVGLPHGLGSAWVFGLVLFPWPRSASCLWASCCACLTLGLTLLAKGLLAFAALMDASIMGAWTFSYIRRKWLKPSGWASMFCKARSWFRIISLRRAGFEAMRIDCRSVSGSFSA